MPRSTRERAVALGDIARIKVSRGEVDAALGLHEERLRVFESLGDQRSRAVTLGDLARIKVDRGEVDAALGLQDECLDVTRRLGDQEGIAVAQNDRFDLLLQKQRWQDAREAISESFTILTPIGRLDGLGVVGMKFGRFLAQAGQTDGSELFAGASSACDVVGSWVLSESLGITSCPP